MFNYQSLYAGSPRLSRIVGFHSMAMSVVCKKTDGSQLASIASTLGLSTLQRRVISFPNFPQYLVARDAVGYQIFLDSPNAPGSIWLDMMTKGAGLVTGVSGSVGQWLLRIGDLMNAIYADFLPTFTDSVPIFLGGFGVGAIAMQCLAEKLKVQSKDPRFVAMTGAPHGIDGDMYDRLQVDRSNCIGTDDLWAQSPPTILSYAPHWQNTAPPLPPLFHPARTFLLLHQSQLSRYILNAFNEAIVDRSSPQAWPGNIPTPFDQFHDSGLYAYRYWATMPPAEQQILSQWATVLNGTFPAAWTYVVGRE
jgi:hypothetical protein